MSVEHLWYYSEGDVQKMPSVSLQSKPSEATNNSDFFSSLCNIADHRLYKIVKWCKSLPLFRHVSVSKVSRIWWTSDKLLSKNLFQYFTLSCCFFFVYVDWWSDMLAVKFLVPTTTFKLLLSFNPNTWRDQSLAREIGEPQTGPCPWFRTDHWKDAEFDRSLTSFKGRPIRIRLPKSYYTLDFRSVGFYSLLFNSANSSCSNSLCVCVCVYVHRLKMWSVLKSQKRYDMLKRKWSKRCRRTRCRIILIIPVNSENYYLEFRNWKELVKSAKIPCRWNTEKEKCQVSTCWSNFCVASIDVLVWDV